MQEVSFDLLSKKLRRYPHLNELKSFVSRIEKTKLKLLLLYGSLAKGTYTQYSDIDILCVYDQHFASMKERFQASYKFSEGIVQPKTITYEELEIGLKEGDSFLHGIFDHGIILYNTISNDLLYDWIEKGKKKVTMRYFSH